MSPRNTLNTRKGDIFFFCVFPCVLWAIIKFRRKQMKKTFFITILMMLVFTVTALPGAAEKKTVNYQKVEQFMAEYYNAYNLYAQDAQTMDLMDEYWAPEFTSIQFLPLPEPLVMDLFTWKNFLVFAHLNMIETLTLKELSIDTKNLSVTARVEITFIDRATGDLLLNLDCVGFYNLKVNKKNKIQITCLKLYFADPEALMALGPPSTGM